MPSLGDMIIRVGAHIDGFTAAMGSLGQQLRAAERQANKTFGGIEKIGDKFEGMGKQMSIGISVPLAGVAGVALKTAGDFELSMNKIKAFGDISGESLEKLRKQALKLGADTQFSAQEAADAQVVFASAGMKVDQVYAALPGTLNLAAAGQLAVGDAATITKDILGQFGLEASKTGLIADVLAQASADASSSLSEMALTLTYAGPVAKGAGQSLEETTAAIVALDAAGIRGEKAGTGLRGVIASIVAPSTDASKAMESLGISVSDSSGKMRPISDIMEQFRQKLGSMSSEVERQGTIFQIFGREAGNSAQVLINTGGPALDAIEQKLLNSGGAADKMAKTINSGLNFSLDQLKGSLETAAIAFGTALIPAATRALNLATEFINTALMPMVEWFAKLSPGMQDTIIGFGMVVAAIGPVLLIAGSLISATASIAGAFSSLSMVLGGPALLGGISALPGMFSSIATAVSSNMVGALTAGELALLRMGQAALVAAAAFAAWKLGEWAYNNIPAVKALGDSIADLILKIPGAEAALLKLTGASGAQAAASKDLSLATQKLEASLKAKGITVNKTGLTTAEYSARLLATAKDAKLLGTEQATTTARVEAAKREVAEAKAKMDAYSKALGGTATEAKKTSTEHVAATQAIKQYKDGIPAAIIDEYARKVKALQHEIARSAIETQLATVAGRDWSSQLSKNIADAQALADKLTASHANEMPKYVVGLGSIGKASTGLTDGLKAAADQATGHLGAIAVCAEDTATKTKTSWGGVGSQVSTIMTDLSRDISKAFVGLVTGEGNFAERMGNALKGVLGSMGEAITRFGAEQLTGKLFKWFGELTSDILPGVGKALNSALGIGVSTGASAAGSAVNTAVGAGGTAATTAAGVAGSAGSSAAKIGGQIAGTSMTAMVGAIGSVGSMVSGIIGNFQNAKMETTMNAIEESTRYVKIWTGEQSQSLLWCAQKTVENLGYVNTTLDTLGRFASEQLAWLERTGAAVEDLARRPAAPPPIVITVQGNVIGNGDFLDQMAGAVGAKLRLQGGAI